MMVIKEVSVSVLEKSKTGDFNTQRWKTITKKQCFVEAGKFDTLYNFLCCLTLWQYCIFVNSESVDIFVVSC